MEGINGNLEGVYMAKILIVEDDKRTNEAICEYLKPTGYEIVSAYDGDEAVTGNRQLCLSHLSQQPPVQLVV